MTMSVIVITNAGNDTTESGMNKSTPRIMTGEGTIDDKETGISDTTEGEGIFAGKSIGKQPENTTMDQAQTLR